MKTSSAAPFAWTATMLVSKGGRSMSHGEQMAYGVASTVSYAGTNILAWATGFDAGAVATGFTVISLAGFAAYSKWVKVRGEQKAEETRLEVERIREVERAKAEAWAGRVRLEMQVQADREKLEAGSLNGQIKALQAAVDESNRVAAENKSRVEDANKKLHELANERQSEVLRHHAELEMLMKQLELVTHELEDSRQENRVLMSKLEAKVQAGTAAIDRIVSPDTGTSDMETLA